MGKKPGKRKNPGVGVDFRKVKHKVGKRLPAARNETRTDFSARAINLPSQSVGADKGGAAVSERNLTLKVGWKRAWGHVLVLVAARPVLPTTRSTPTLTPPANTHTPHCRSWWRRRPTTMRRRGATRSRGCSSC
jgi:hypothetical protein